MRPQDPKQANTNIKIKKSNYDDLQKAAAFVKPENKAFYKDLPYEGKSDDDSESDSEEYDYAEIQPFRFDDSWLTTRQQYFCCNLLSAIFCHIDIAGSAIDE